MSEEELDTSMAGWPQQARDDFYTHQQVHGGNAANNLDRQAYIKRMVPQWKPETILDVACRDGYISRFFMPEIHVIGVDINPIAIQMAKEMAARIKGSTYHYYIENILESEAILEDIYDLVMCFEFIEHVPPNLANKIFKKMHAWSSDICSISTPRLDGKFGSDGDDDGHINLYDEDRLRAEILEATGVDPVIEQDDNFYYVHWRVK